MESWFVYLQEKPQIPCRCYFMSVQFLHASFGLVSEDPAMRRQGLLCSLLGLALPGKTVFFLVALNSDCDGDHAYNGDDDAQYYWPADATGGGLM